MINIDATKQMEYERKDSPFRPLSANEISSELAEARLCYERGEYEDFDDALEEISLKYGLQNDFEKCRSKPL